MATRVAARFVPRRLMSRGKVLGEEEKAAENVYIKKIEQEKMEKLARKKIEQEKMEKLARKKIEQEKMEKLARKGPKPEDKPPTANDVKTKATDAKTSNPASSTSGVSTDKLRNYGVAAALAAGFGTLGWYLGSRKKKTEEVH